MVEQDLDAVTVIERLSYRFPWSVGSFLSCLTHRYDSWLACCDEEIVGYGIQLVGAGEAQLLNLCVTPDWRRQGVAQIILERLLDRARSLGADTVFLEVRPSNIAARALYEDFGFCEVSQRHNYYRSERGFEHALVLARTLDSR